MSNYDDKFLTMASWGIHASSNSLSDRTMEMMSSADCAKAFYPPFITQSVICSKDSHCAGDSGSALVDERSPGDYVVVGIASFTYGECTEGVRKPSVFMRVSSFLDFIRSNSDLLNSNKITKD